MMCKLRLKSFNQTNKNVVDHHFRFEKYIGGKYLGELMRLVLVDLYQKKLIFQNTPATAFPEPWSFDTSKISAIEEFVAKILFCQIFQLDLN